MACNPFHHLDTRHEPDRSSIVLVLGVLSLVICAPLGIAAWVMGASDLREMDAGLRVADGRSTAKAGMICGIIGTVLFVLQVLLGLLFFVFFGVVGMASV
ncbi:MAG TPA: hypothetical protein DCG14_07835 [Phycisphaerales bacterium]|nr:hypothetical protein [Phycisphaerales bacterium]